MKKIAAIVILSLAFCCINLPSFSQADTLVYHEQYRPLIHFSPKAHWMNDPNGMVYYKGVYHLFFQHYPSGSIWGPMHWGHATSKDLLHWNEQPIALYPDKLGYIFSGSAVVDFNNTSGFGKNGVAPLVAIFTSHDTTGERAGRNNFQTQSLAYSLDDGKTWNKYAGNPVIANPGIRDFRDPKVSWYAPGNKWIMTLATKDRITFYSSANLKQWKKESEFGATIGAHGGVWECPDLFTLNHNGKQHWVLFISINPGAPNGGSGTQYFVGQFDGHSFTPYDTREQWVDYGPDDYAGVTWSNTGMRKIFLGWMSNWNYANIVPTERWRSANTIPRELRLKEVSGRLYVASTPVKELESLVQKRNIIGRSLTNNYTINKEAKYPLLLNASVSALENFAVTLTNNKSEKVVIGFDKKANNFYINRTASGNTGFANNFAGNFTAPRTSKKQTINFSLLIDASSVELFADDGLSVMTALVFPSLPYENIKLESAPGISIVSLSQLKNIWVK